LDFHGWFTERFDTLDLKQVKVPEGPAMGIQGTVTTFHRDRRAGFDHRRNNGIPRCRRVPIPPQLR
jgi:hypothetical protein